MRGLGDPGEFEAVLGSAGLVDIRRGINDLGIEDLNLGVQMLALRATEMCA